jgi:hypothetical protein
MMSRPISLSVLLSLQFTLVAGCGEQQATSVPPTMTASDNAAPVKTEATVESMTVASERKAFDGLKFMIPPSWKEVSLSQFQMGIISAKFEMPEAGPDVTLTLSRSGGGIEANLDRWKGQVTNKSKEETETVTVAGVDATLIDMEGRFSGGFGREPADGWRMLGVIAPLSDQGYFMKLTGPIDQVKAVEEDFRAFIKSAVLD